MTSETNQRVPAKHGADIRVRSHGVLKEGAFGKIQSSTYVEIPEGYVGMLAVREKYGDLNIILTSPIIWAGFKGYPNLHIKNDGVAPLYFTGGMPIAHIAIMKTLESE